MFRQAVTSVWKVRQVRVIARIFLVVLLFYALQFLYTLYPDRSKEQLGVYKMILAARGGIIGYAMVKILFPFVKMRDLFLEDKPNETCDSIKLVAATILYGLIIGGTIIGVLLGV